MIGAILFALTSAWYTNTIQANEITLNTAKWNFEGTITLGDEKDGTLALGDLYPGDTRLLPVTIVNQDASRGVNIRVEADKSSTPAEMQQRLYLYVEKTDKTGIKTRHYINSLSGYLYAVGAKQTLHITDTESTSSNNNEIWNNTELLHLQWVYDLTGYFLLGTVSTDGKTVTGKTADTQPEYLMPVTYDLDRAQFDTDGKLRSVSEYQTTTNGTSGAYATTDRENYLKLLFEQYISEYNSNANPYGNKTTVHGSYYAVDVDETGYGVWLYLPDKSAIDAAAQWDQETAATAATQPISLKLVFKAQNQPTTANKEQQP